MTNVIVVRKRTSGIIDSTNPVVLKPLSVLSSAAASPRLDHLQDVNASEEVDGATLVYDAENDTYIVKLLDLSEVTGILDGGNF